MEEVQSAGAEFGAFDVMLIGVFFISYSVFALTQLNNLYSARFLLFIGLAAGSAALAFGLGELNVSGFCADTNSAIVCGNEGRALRSFGLVWAAVSAAALAMFALARGLAALRDRR